MAVLVDTAPLVAVVNTRDPAHRQAREIFKDLSDGAHGVAWVPDHVYVETHNFLRGRRAPRGVLESLQYLIRLAADGTAPMKVCMTTRGQLAEARALYVKYEDQGLSLTDCVVLFHAKSHGAPVVTFDQGFKGLADTIGV